jgi:hypothetical protein
MLISNILTETFYVTDLFLCLRLERAAVVSDEIPESIDGDLPGLSLKHAIFIQNK